MMLSIEIKALAFGLSTVNLWVPIPKLVSSNLIDVDRPDTWKLLSLILLTYKVDGSIFVDIPPKTKLVVTILIGVPPWWE